MSPDRPDETMHVSLPERFQDIVGNDMRIPVGDGRRIEPEHAGSGVAHDPDDIIRRGDAVFAQRSAMEGFFRIGHIAAVGVTAGAELLEQRLAALLLFRRN